MCKERVTRVTLKKPDYKFCYSTQYKFCYSTQDTVM